MLYPDAQKRADVVAARITWKANESQNLDIPNTYWLDESSVNCAMTRVYGRALSHERVVDYVPDVRFERTSIISAVGVKGVIAPFVFRGTLNQEVFKVYVDEILAREHKQGDTLVLDNARVHTVKGVMQSLIDKGIKVIFLPKYSPDLNPIEFAWSKVKTYLKKEKARNMDDLLKVIPEALDYISSTDIKGWISHCGYAQ